MSRISSLFIGTILLLLYLVGSGCFAQVWQSWAARYDGPGGGEDWPEAITCDADGYIYVAGYSIGNGTNYDFAVVKYTPWSVELWAARYDGPAGGEDRAHALAVDDQGNVYLTGRSRDETNDIEWATVKYDLNGVEQWAMRYAGASGEGGVPDGIAVDVLGNVYVTGEIFDTLSYNDMTIVKYDSDGILQWEATYRGPGNSQDYVVGTTSDSDGNIYITGKSSNVGYDEDITTVKFNSEGVEQWVAFYDGSGNEMGEVIAVDEDGNVYVSGRSLISGSYNFDFTTIKYDANGVEQWVAQYDGPGHEDDHPMAIAVNGDGCVFVTGISNSLPGYPPDFDYATVKYSAEGTELWAARYNGPARQNDSAYDLVLDLDGNAIVTGYTEFEGAFNYDYASVKYDESGNELWSILYDGPVSDSDQAVAITVSYDGSIYVTGHSDQRTGFLENDDFATIKYNQNGPPTPVVLTAFEAKRVTGNVELTWTTASEIDCYGWFVERCPFNGHYQIVSSLIPGFGNSNELHNYVYMDKAVQPDLTYQYRLQQIDNGGCVTFSESITVTGQSTMVSEFILHPPHPNPFNPTTMIRYQLPEVDRVNLQVYDLWGRLIETIVDLEMTAGVHEFNWDASDLPSGVYLIRLQAGDVKQVRKAILMK